MTHHNTQTLKALMLATVIGASFGTIHSASAQNTTAKPFTLISDERSGESMERKDRSAQQGFRAGMMFAELDSDGDRKISKQEFAAHRSERFANMDADADGTVTAAEIETHMQARLEERMQEKAGFMKKRMESRMGKMRERMIQRLDTDGDGRITREEFDAQAEARFARLDANSDGSLEAEEMMKAREDFKNKRSQMKRGTDQQ